MNAFKKSLFLLFKSGQDSDVLVACWLLIEYFAIFFITVFIYFASFVREFKTSEQKPHTFFCLVSSLNGSQVWSYGFAFPPTVVNKKYPQS